MYLFEPRTVEARGNFQLKSTNNLWNNNPPLQPLPTSYSHVIQHHSFIINLLFIIYITYYSFHYSFHYSFTLDLLILDFYDDAEIKLLRTCFLSIVCLGSPRLLWPIFPSSHWRLYRIIYIRIIDRYFFCIMSRTHVKNSDCHGVDLIILVSKKEIIALEFKGYRYY